MDRTLTLQVSGQVLAMAMAWQTNSGILCCGQKNGTPSLGLSVSNGLRRVHELQVWRLQFNCCRSCSDGKYVRKAKRRALVCCSVLNEVEQNSPQLDPAPDIVKDQLETLQDEALQVHNRYNNARARFMRLTEVAQQLRQRAAIDLKLGNEDAARKALVEKQKVIQAAELSRTRAQLLEALSTKLGEAISAKETQYIVALSTPQREERTVRVVSPKGEGLSSVDQDLDEEGNPSSLGTAEASQICHERTDTVDLEAVATEDMNGDKSQAEPLSGDLLLQREKLSLEAELGHSTDRFIYGNVEDGEAGVPVHDSYNMNVSLEREEFVRDDRNLNVQSGSLLPKDSLQGESLPRVFNGRVEESMVDIGISHSPSDLSNVDDLQSGATRSGEVAEPTMSPEYVDARDGSEEVGSAGLDGVDQSERFERSETIPKDSFNDVRRRLVERLILDVHHQVTTIELRLQTEVSRSMDSNDTELQIVRDLLEQVQTLRARISEAVVLLSQKET